MVEWRVREEQRPDTDQCWRGWRAWPTAQTDLGNLVASCRRWPGTDQELNFKGTQYGSAQRVQVVGTVRRQSARLGQEGTKESNGEGQGLC